MRKQRKVINLFEDKNIFSIKHVTSISTEEDLNQFWDFLLDTENSSHQLIRFITQFYNFSLEYLRNENSNFFEIILEENDSFVYFTLWNQAVSSLFAKHLEKCTLESLDIKNRISIKIPKEKKPIKIKSIKQKKQKKIIKVLEPYTFIEIEDLDELLKLNDDLQEVVYQLKKHGFNHNLFISFRSILSLICLTLRYYQEIKMMATTITDFSNLINTNQEKLLEIENEEMELIIGFINNIDTWLQTLFVKGGAELSFMDNSIQADYNTIVHIIDADTLAVEDTNLDDIFDF